jgi:hypothetical protein
MQPSVSAVLSAVPQSLRSCSWGRKNERITSVMFDRPHTNAPILRFRPVGRANFRRSSSSTIPHDVIPHLLYRKRLEARPPELRPGSEYGQPSAGQTESEIWQREQTRRGATAVSGGGLGHTSVPAGLLAKVFGRRPERPGRGLRPRPPRRVSTLTLSPELMSACRARTSGADCGRSEVCRDRPSY